MTCGDANGVAEPADRSHCVLDKWSICTHILGMAMKLERGVQSPAAPTIVPGSAPPPPAAPGAASAASVGATPELIGAREQKAIAKTVAVTERAPAQGPKTYDYVFIGAGATGGTAAADLMPLLEQVAELRKQGFSVLVLEGGKDKEVQASKIPLEHGIASEHPELLTDPNNTGKGTGYWVKHFTNPEDGKKDTKANADGEIWKPRGEGFGGSTRMNANVFIRVDDVDWDNIALMTGDPAFRAENMKVLAQELEKNEYRPLLRAMHEIGKATGVKALQNMHGHGFDGVLETTTADPKLLLEDKQLAAVAIKTLLWSSTRLGSVGDKMKRMLAMFDPNDNRTQGTEGAVLMPTTIKKDGSRNGARQILLDAAKKFPDQLTLQDGARVKNLVLDDDNRCTGVVYVDKQGAEHQVQLRREAIVAAGAIETPALLMRSGIGPKAELDKLVDQGVQPKVVLEGVGQKQGDRYEVGVVYRLKKPFKLLQDVKLPAAPDDPNFKRWQAGDGGALASNGVIASFQVKSDPKLKEPDLFIFAVPGKFGGYKPGYSQEATADPHLLTFLVLDANKGEGRGTIQLDPKNPLGAPIVNHHFHKERGAGDDSQALVFGVQKVRELIKSQFSDLVESEEWPGAGAKTPAQLKEAVEAESWGHHPRGGAQMGHANDKSTVVDADFRVLGTTGIRVIDASMLPDNIGTFIVSGLYQVGKLAAKKIAKDAEEGPQPAAQFNPLSIRNNPKPEKLDEAQKVTAGTADAAKAEGLLSLKQHERLTDGTVSQVDVDVAWAAISDVLERGKIGGDRHTIAHNLLLAVTQQLEKQSDWKTRAETFRDQVSTLVRAG